MNEQEKALYGEKMTNQFHTMGRILLAFAYVLMFSAPILFGRMMGGSPNMSGFLRGFFNISIIFLPISIIEFLVYTPMLGVGGTYVGLLTGNLTGLKIPCMMNAREIAKTKIGTPEDEVISTLSIATCALTSIVVIFIGVMLFVPMTHLLESEYLRPAFDNVIPALFGALGIKYFMKQKAVASISLIVMSLLTILVPAIIPQTSMLIIPAGTLSIAVALLLVKFGKIEVS